MISNDPDIFRPYSRYICVCWLVCVCVSVSYYVYRIYPWYKVSVQHKTFLLRDYARNWDPRKTHTHTQTTICYDYYCYYDIVIMHSLTDSVLLAFSFFRSRSRSRSHSLHAAYLSKICAHFSPHTLCAWKRVLSIRFQFKHTCKHIIIYINRLSHTLAHLCYFQRAAHTIVYPRSHSRLCWRLSSSPPPSSSLPPFLPIQKVTTLYDTYYIVFNKDI